jgi:hypothetical protein
LPIAVGFPFGLSIVVPVNMPLPTKIVTQVLQPIDISPHSVTIPASRRSTRTCASSCTAPSTGWPASVVAYLRLTHWPRQNRRTASARLSGRCNATPISPDIDEQIEARLAPFMWKTILDTRVLIVEDLGAAPTPLAHAQVEC